MKLDIPRPLGIYLIAVCFVFLGIVGIMVFVSGHIVYKEPIKGVSDLSTKQDNKRALILHGWGSGPGDHWFLQEKTLLEEAGYEVALPQLPSKYLPTENIWLKYVEVFEPDEQSVLIGFSLGGTTILEYLENNDVKVDLVALVVTPIEYTDQLKEDNIGGFKLFLQSVATEAFLETCKYDEIYDWEKIRSRAEKFVLIYKTGDVRVPPVQGEFLAEKLSADLTIVQGDDHGHTFDLSLINRELAK